MRLSLVCHVDGHGKGKEAYFPSRAISAILTTHSISQHQQDLERPSTHAHRPLTHQDALMYKLRCIQACKELGDEQQGSTGAVSLQAVGLAL